MQKLKNLSKKFFIYASVLFASACLLLGVVYGVSKASIEMADYLFPAYIVTEVNVPKKVVKPLTMKEYVLKEVAKAKLDVGVVDCIITKESRWDTWAYNINKDGSSDFGLFQINSVHKGTISVEDRFNYKTATAWALNKMKKDGYGAWVAYKSCSHLARK